MKIHVMAVLNQWMDIAWPPPPALWPVICEWAESHKARHYLLVSLPSLTWEPCLLNTGPGTCHARIHGHVNGTSIARWIEVRYPPDVGYLHFEQHPDNGLVAIGADRTILHQATTVSRLLQLLKVEGHLDNSACEGLMDCQVEYVGKTEQSWSPSRNRLLRHHRLPNLKRHMDVLAPRRELNVLLAGIGGMSGIGHDGSPEPLDAPIRMDDISPESLTAYGRHSHVIAAVEAALITYFMPRWNRTYKRTFPSPRHRSYQWVRDRGLDAIGVELHRWGMPTALTSAMRPARHIHGMQVHLNGPDGYPVLGTDGYSQSDQVLLSWLNPKDRETKLDLIMDQRCRRRVA